MKLDKDLNATQLWTIASDEKHRDPELLDQLVDHPATYRALSDWAVAALGEEDMQSLPAPPPPEEEPETTRKGLRLPAVNLLRRRQASPSSADSAVEAPGAAAPSTPTQEDPSVFQSSAAPTDPPVHQEDHAEGRQEHPEEIERTEGGAEDLVTAGPSPFSEIPVLPAAPVTQDAPAPASPAVPQQEDTPEEDGLGAWLAAAPTAAPEPAPPAAGPPVAPPGAMPPSAPRVSWLRRPAPMGLVIVLAVIELLTLLALGVIAQREPEPTPPAPAVETVPSSSAPEPSSATAVESASATGGE
ncbi:hypothetical protein [Actinomyces wuliandei]|uniref:hypothetical protein n=1 Tax=Actinomyces wuliandei TaxID=2057743 RepID=UPI001119592A|nr:hypothetical protein [Actinomyces wuliandei]